MITSRATALLVICVVIATFFVGFAALFGYIAVNYTPIFGYLMGLVLSVACTLLFSSTLKELKAEIERVRREDAVLK